MLHKLKKQNQGFTIIEVLIVLAIAGLILLIVFLAVPALQRNSRNTRVKNDAARLIGAVREYQSTNNNAAPPDAATLVLTSGSLSSASASEVYLGTAAPAVNLAAGLIYLGAGGFKIAVYSAGSCDGTNLAPGTKVVAAYRVETAGDPAAKCTEG